MYVIKHLELTFTIIIHKVSGLIGEMGSGHKPKNFDRQDICFDIDLDQARILRDELTKLIDDK